LQKHAYDKIVVSGLTKGQCRRQNRRRLDGKPKAKFAKQNRLGKDEKAIGKLPQKRRK